MTELRITREEKTYERRGPNSCRSFFRDWTNAESDPKARARLQRHMAEARVELPRQEARMAKAEGVEYRVNPNRTVGDGAAFAPPLWANEYFATAPRPKKILAGLIPNFDLPEKVASVNMPRILPTGTETGTPPDVAPVPDRDFTDAAVSCPAMTVTGNSDVAMQLLEQSPLGAALDAAILKDLQDSGDAELEAKLFTGGGVEKRECTGILNLPTGAGLTSKVEYSGTHGYEMFKALGKVAAQLGDARKCPPEVWLMRTARWAYLGTEEDEEKLPLAVPGHMAAPPMPFTFDDSRPAVAPPILGWPNYLSDAIPANLGPTGETNRDTIVAIRPTDFMLFESDMKTSVLTEVLSGTHQARFTSRRYASVLWRQPTAISYLTGTGMKVESEY